MSAIYNNVFQDIAGRITVLGDVAQIIKGKQINGELLSDVGEYYVMNGGIDPSGYYDSYNTLPNTISISEGGNSCGYVQWNETAFWSGGHCYTLHDINSDVAGKYLYHFLKWREDDIMKLRIGSGLPNIQKKDLSKVMVIIPNQSIQTKIVYLLDACDEKIAQEIRILMQYNHQKTFLLSKMFI